MKLEATINIGNYSNITIKSSEHDNVAYAKIEMCNIGAALKEPAVIDFCNKYFNN